MSDAPRSKNQHSDGRFSRRADGVIVDHQSGFEWFALPDSCNWDHLMTSDPSAHLPGEGWRMPTRAELQTLVAHRRNADGRYLDAVFEGVPHAEQVWTDDWGNPPGTVWSFDFGRGKAVEDWDHPTHHLGVLMLRATAR
jgi:hypothetical protein